MGMGDEAPVEISKRTIIQEQMDELDDGDLVIDREDENADEAVVINTPPKEAREWNLENRSGTVADDNPEYPEEAPVVSVIYKDEIEEHYPYYTGGRSLELSDVRWNSGAKFYTFPRPRLKKVGKLGPCSIPLDELEPFPYHSRNFSAEENREYMEDIRERGEPENPPVVQVLDDGFRIINGHKRVWASYVCGLKEVDCVCLYVDDKEATKHWVENHLFSYRGEHLDEAMDSLTEDWWINVSLEQKDENY
jgi:ParB family chromosome partitioning protein